MKLWRGEDYFLQIDSHHRFVRDWDMKLIELARRTGSPKLILSTYPAPFMPGEIEPTDGEVWHTKFDDFTADGIQSFVPAPVQALTEPTRPLRARFVAAGFLASEFGVFILKTLIPRVSFVIARISHTQLGSARQLNIDADRAVITARVRA
jgi:hypothetical protein